MDYKELLHKMMLLEVYGNSAVAHCPSEAGNYCGITSFTEEEVKTLNDLQAQAERELNTGNYRWRKEQGLSEG